MTCVRKIGALPANSLLLAFVVTTSLFQMTVLGETPRFCIKCLCMPLQRLCFVYLVPTTQRHCLRIHQWKKIEGAFYRNFTSGLAFDPTTSLGWKLCTDVIIAMSMVDKWMNAFITIFCLGSCLQIYFENHFSSAAAFSLF